MCRKLLLSYRVLRTEMKKPCHICSIIYHKNNISFIVLKKYIALAQFLLTSSGGYIQCFLSLSIKMPDLEEIAVHKIIHFAVCFLTRPELRNFLIEITVISTMLFSGATIFCLLPVWLLFPYRHHPCNRHQAHCDYLLTLRCQISNLPRACCDPSLGGHVSRRGSLLAKWNSSDGYLKEDGQVLIYTQTYLSHYMTLCCKGKNSFSLLKLENQDFCLDFIVLIFSLYF